MRNDPLRAGLLFVVILSAGAAEAQEAVTHLGKRMRGLWRQDVFVQAQTGRAVPLSEVRLLYFSEAQAEEPRCRLLHQLLLSGDQQLAGELLSLGPKELRFRTAAGAELVLARSQVHGVRQADSFLVQMLEDFEDATEPNRWLGMPTFSAEHVFSGKKSLIVDAHSSGCGLALNAPYAPEAALQRATVHFYDLGLKRSGSAQVRWLFEGDGMAAPLDVLLGSQHYVLSTSKEPALKASKGWHVLQIEWTTGTVRTFIDDFYLGSLVIPNGAACRSVRFACVGEGRWWFDGLHLSKRAAPLPSPTGSAPGDEVWLESGDELFGSLLQADARAVILDARFGKRSFSWRDVRGIFFQAGAEKQDEPALVRFRSGPGVSSDQLAGKILDLNKDRLLLRHAVLGDVAIGRRRLERIYFPERADR